MTDHIFTASIALPDGRSIYVSLDVPADHPSTEAITEFLELTELVQMAAATVLRHLRRNDYQRPMSAEVAF